MPYLTGDDVEGGTVCRPLLIPDDLHFRAAVAGAIYELTQASNWEQYGTVTPDEAAAAALAMYMAFVSGECVAGGDMELLGSVVLSADAGQMAFDGIPGTYANLHIVGQMRTDYAAHYDHINVNCNDDYGNNYDWAGSYYRHTSSNFTNSALNTNRIALWYAAAGNLALANSYQPALIDIPAYAGVGQTRMLYLYGSGIAQGTNTSGLAQVMNVGNWRNAVNPITKLAFAPSAGTVFRAGSALQLYGLNGT